MISIGKRLVTSTNLEYSFFFLLLLFCFSTFLSLSKLMSALKYRLPTHLFLEKRKSNISPSRCACNLVASNDYDLTIKNFVTESSAVF